MDTGSILILAIIVLLIILSAFFSSAETAMMSSSKIKIRNLADKGDQRANVLLKLLDNQSKMLSTILIGNNIVNIVTSSLTTIFAQRVFGNVAISIATAVITLVVLIFGEITPKTSASINPEKMALNYARVIYVITVIFTPIIFVVNSLAKGIMKLLKIDTSKQGQTITESELRSIVDVSHEEGVLESEEKKIINNLIDFGDDTAKDIMVPRVSVTCIDVNATYEELIDTFKIEHFTRMPVYEDSNDNIIGIINMKDIVLYNQSEPFSVRNYLREASFAFEGKSLSEMMLEMKRTSVNMTIILDEYGAFIGIITLEDLLEELVGEIRDEFDADEYEELKKLPNGDYIAEGQINLDDLNDKLETNIISEEYDSLGGFIIEKLDRLPKENDIVITDNILLKVVKLDKNRIEKVRISKK